MRVYLSKGVQGTTAIEGNPLSEADVIAIIKKQLRLPLSMEYQQREVENILNAMNALVRLPQQRDLSIDEICRMNLQTLDGLQFEAHVRPGQLREDSVGVKNYRCPSPDDVPRHMRSFEKWYNGFPAEQDDLDPQSMAIIKAIAAHLYFVLIHPFADGNGRTARLIEWTTLDRAGIPSVASHLLSNHYNLTRPTYYSMLERASMGGDTNSFLCYAISCLVEQLDAQLKYIHEQYADLVFLNMVWKRTPGGTSNVRRRRREVALAICAAPGAVPKDEIRKLNSTLGAAYAATSDRTLSRNLQALEDESLIVETPKGWLALTDAMYWRHVRDNEQR